MRQFLNRNSVSIAGLISASISGIFFYIEAYGEPNFGFDYGGFLFIYTVLLGLFFGFAIGLASVNRINFSAENLITLYPVASELIYLGVVFLTMLVSSIDDIKGNSFLNFLGFGCACGVGAVVLLYLSKRCLHLKLNKALYIGFFCISTVITTLCFNIEGNFATRMTIAIPLWQLSFAVALNEILKRQKQESLKTALSVPEQIF